MASDYDSEDEPLSVLAQLKNQNSSGLEITPVYTSKKAKKKSAKQKSDLSIELQPLYETPTNLPEKPTDVWLYLTDFNPTGPYSCLLCPEWFINRARIVIHYAIDHKKDYCGICRYFVPNRDAWQAHLQLHVPHRCSLCPESFPSEPKLREHFSSIHKLVHCRLCHLRLQENEQYHSHLERHCIKDIMSVYGDTLWDFQYRGSQKFRCLLCLKSLNVGKQFADHYMSYHHLTLRCFMNFISGYDLPFKHKGVELTPDFIETQLNAYSSYGYVDFVKTVKVKQEVVQEEEAVTTVDTFQNPEPELKPIEDIKDEAKYMDELKGYKGEEDFDMTLMELIIMHQCYFDYVNDILNEINSNVIPASSDIDYVNNINGAENISCCLCKYVCRAANSLEMHVSKAHGIKTLPIYWCRVCAAVFDTLPELESHIVEELGEFEDLWICQFCDKEFDDREETRKHLTEHWHEIDFDNCFSPHLGFKCKFCPSLFWNETDRELHHVKAHYKMLKSDFYKCTSCGEIFGDKVFFIHHYLAKHNSDKPPYLFKCCICCVVLHSVDEMREHFTTEHKDATKVFCSMDQCKYRPFCHRKSFFVHLRSVHFPSGRPQRIYDCKTCGQQFSSAKERTAHSMLSHGPGKFKCNVCNELLHTNDERKIHYLIRHPGQYEYQCTECNKSFQYKSSLYMHKQDHIPNKPSYACNYCGKVFLKRDSYREHVMIHQAPRHACSYCPMRFVQRSNMLRHERRHTGERPYSCKYCPRTFSDKGACTSHLRTHLKNTSFICVYCGQTFVQKSKLTYHIRKHTGENLETCQICSKTFTSGCALREHLRVHERHAMKKTIKCPLCNNLYSDEKTMLRHMRAAHTGNKFKCPLCRKCVTSASSLRDHVVTHSRMKTFLCNICPKSYHAKKSMIKHVQKRHSIKRGEVKLGTHYRQLDPKECNLGISDEDMERIFGNIKNKPNPEFVGDNTVKFKSVNIKTEPASSASEMEEQEAAKQTESKREKDNKHYIQIKIEPNDEDAREEQEEMEQEMTPQTNFVDVKVECMDEEPSNSEME